MTGSALAPLRALPAAGCRDADHPLEPRHAFLEHRRLKRAGEAIDQLEQVGSL